ncbi:MAG: alpha/beta fold hydrolase [Anaerolineales bacterium]
MIDPLILSHAGAGSPLVFAHANGYPPDAYRTFLEPFLKDYQVEAIYLRPFWPGSDPDHLRDWRGFRDDYLEYLFSRMDQFQIDGSLPSSHKILGIGHSVGAMTTIMAAIQRPEYFRLLVLIEPVLFTRARGSLMRLIAPLNILRQVHPLIKGTLRRKRSFSDRDAMFENYRAKKIFQRLSDQVLGDYVDGLALDLPDGRVGLKYSPDWEARIYETGGLADWYVWKNLSRISCPVLVIRGELTDTLQPITSHNMVKKMVNGKGLTVPGAGHLLPLEKPYLTAEIILDYLQTDKSELF